MKFASLTTIFGICAFLLLLLLTACAIYRAQTKQISKQLQTKVDNLNLYNKINKTTCNLPYPVYYINMDKDIDRKMFMDSQLSRITNDYHRVSGFNGYGITNNHVGTVDGISFTNSYNNLTRSEIGCTLSHLLAIKAGYESGADIVMICEDDLFLGTCSLIPSLSNVVRDAPDDWEILQLFGMNSRLSSIYSKLSDFPEVKYVKREYPRSIFWSSACYLINKRGMERILSVVNKIPSVLSIVPIKKSYPTGGSADRYIYDLVNVYTVLPCLFTTNNTQLESKIHESDTPEHIRQSLIVISKFKQLPSDKQFRFAKTLLDMDKILRKYNQPYFLACGTALGVVREGQFIEHDSDIDLGVFRDDYNPEIESRILEVFKLKHRFGSINTGYELSFIHPETGVSLDIFLHYKENFFYWYPTFLSVCDKAKNKMCRWKYTPFGLKPIEFFGGVFNLPDPIDLYLTESYGDWKTPKSFSYEEGITEGGYTNLILEDFPQSFIRNKNS